MSYYKFNEDDIFFNRVKTYPSCVFNIYNGVIYYNNNYYDTGHFLKDDDTGVNHVPSGHITAYEINVDRDWGAHTYDVLKDTGNKSLIYPFVTKGGSFSSFKTTSTEEFNHDFQYGDIISASYPLSASIVREYFRVGLPASGSDTSVVSTTVSVVDPDSLKEKTLVDAPKLGKAHLRSLKNTLNYYKSMSKHYEFSNSERNLLEDTVNLISIPSIFYGSTIKKGTVDLRFYGSGSLMGQLKDIKQNGELIQVGPRGHLGSGSVAGVVLYNEGFILLTASHILSASDEFDHKEEYDDLPGVDTYAAWIYFGIGANDGSGSLSHATSSFYMAFSGTHYIPTKTMLAHAHKGELNWSNNPTYVDFSQSSIPLTSSTHYKELNNTSIKNTISSSYGCNFTASFKKQTFIDKIGIYDEDKNLIGIAKVANPVRKLETDDYTFKLKIDF